MISSQQLVDLSSYLSLIHHVKGRIRVRVSPKVKELNASGITLEDVEKIPQSIQGIKKVKINKIVGSITIEYDASVFPYELWEDLLHQRNLEKITEMINQLSKDLS